MDLTLSAAAARLQLTERQVRYMIKTGRLAARKVADRWLIAEADLPGGGDHPAKRAAHAEALQQAVQDGLAPVLEGAGRKVWSVQRMRAFTAVIAIHDQLRGRPAGQPAPRTLAALEACAQALSRANHAFHPRAKEAVLHEARNHAADAVALLFLELNPPPVPVADRIEAELIPAISGQLRRAEPRRGG